MSTWEAPGPPHSRGGHSLQRPSCGCLQAGIAGGDSSELSSGLVFASGSSPPLLPTPASSFSGEKVAQGDSRTGVCLVTVTRRLFFFFLSLPDLPELPVSPPSASGSRAEAAVGSWLSSVQVKQLGGGLMGRLRCHRSEHRAKAGGEQPGRAVGSAARLIKGVSRVYVSSRWAGKGRAVRVGGGYICRCG